MRRILGCLLLLVLAACSADDPVSDVPPGNADFEGWWTFDVTVLEDPCPGDVSGQDCFKIQQDVLSLLVVDDAGGNLTGSVDGDEAILHRANARGSVTLTLTMDPGGNRCTGSAVEADSLRGCTTYVDVVGTRRTTTCAGNPISKSEATGRSRP